ncbi:MAG: methyltransferase domain-containing protein [Proteobacteria bacterium]|nr:methyltransferase domain-containing protein [Pseudomonadota bacterium]
MPWDPDQYLKFADHRARPGHELVARIPDMPALKVVDLGCGTGDLTAVLQERWPEASVLGIDSSESMVESARDRYPTIDFVLGDITSWSPREPVDVLFSNAALHWLDDHELLFQTLRGSIAAGGVMAVQMPDNWSAPTHTIPAEVLDAGDWPERARSGLMRDRLASPSDYIEWLQPATVDVWRTTYYQQLAGDDPVWTWVTGSVLRPVLAALDEDDQKRFADICRSLYRDAYPPGASGVTTLAFSRLFIVAQIP